MRDLPRTDDAPVQSVLFHAITVFLPRAEVLCRPVRPLEKEVQLVESLVGQDDLQRPRRLLRLAGRTRSDNRGGMQPTAALATPPA